MVTDKELDTWFERHPEEIPDEKTFYYPLEIWQLNDIDAIEHFDLSRLMMEYYITQGHGKDVYGKYRSSYNG